MTNVPFLTLNNGNKIPQLGLGTAGLIPNELCEEKCLEALKIGYTHFDTAHFYDNEKGVSDAVLKSGIKRENIFITTKIWPTEFDNPELAIEKMFKRINLSYIDLVLLHWPYGDYISAWKILEKYYNEGKIKNIGLSNFYGKKLEDILKICKIKPVVNQVECNLSKNKIEFKKILEKEKILLMAWSPVKNISEEIKKNENIIKMEKKYNKSLIQIILRWHIQSGNIVIPKSANVEHIKNNFEIFDFELSEEEMKILNNLPQTTKGDPDDETEKWVLSHSPKS